MKTRKVEINSEAQCRNCQGTGRAYQQPCEVCEGSGLVNVHKDIYITITPLKTSNNSPKS